MYFKIYYLHLWHGQTNRKPFFRKTNISKNGPNDEKKHFLTKNAAQKSNDQETFHNFTNSLNLNCVTSSYGGKSNSYLEEKTEKERKLSKNKVCFPYLTIS